MRFDPPTGEPTGPSNAPHYDSGELAWPVLTRLPHVGAATASRAVPRAAHLASTEQWDAGRQAATLDSAEPSADSGVRITGETSRSTRQMRVDRGEGRRARGKPKYVRDEPATIAGRLYEFHAAMAPHLGLVGVATLILSASLLYWLAFRPGHTPADPARLLEFDQSWSSETPSPVEAAVEEPAVARDAAVAAPLNWPPAPRVADATAAPNGTNEPAQPKTQGSAKAPATEGAAISPAAAAKPTFDKGATTVVANEPITPTPHTDFYPTTPYPAFSFTSPATSPSLGTAVAEQPAAADGSSATR